LDAVLYQATKQISTFWVYISRLSFFKFTFSPIILFILTEYPSKAMGKNRKSNKINFIYGGIKDE